jgi:hypothetical protein
MANRFKTIERGGTRGFDAHKRVKGRKRHILVDTLGLLVANRVEPADTSDRRAGALLLGGLSALFQWRFQQSLRLTYQMRLRLTAR